MVTARAGLCTEEIFGPVSNFNPSMNDIQLVRRHYKDLTIKLWNEFNLRVTELGNTHIKGHFGPVPNNNLSIDLIDLGIQRIWFFNNF